jgi:hypothetical protein
VSVGYTSTMPVVPAEQLIDMPLHAITEILGETGLRARFVLEAGRFDPPERQRLTTALGLATDLHRNDRRVREPYINHLLRVAIRIAYHYQVRDADVIVASLLHDTVEDHAAELADLAEPATVLGAAHPGGARPHPGASDHRERRERAFGVIGDQFGRRVADMVAAVTNPAYIPHRDPDAQYREHLAESLEHDPWARVIKASDFTDNGVGVIHTTGPKVLRAATKYRPLVPLLRDLIGRPDTPLSPWVKRHIFDQLDLAEERFNDILCDGDPPLASRT